MPHLLKTEPDAYLFTDLERDRETIWDGVTNPAAVKHLREMKPGALPRLVFDKRGVADGCKGQRARCQEAH